MPYPIIASRRMAYDIDGTVVGYGTQTSGILTWLTSANLIKINSEFGASVLVARTTDRVWFFFPEKREIDLFYAYTILEIAGISSIKGLWGSNDTTNGLDGTWEAASLPSGYPSYTNDFSWRSNTKAISFSTSYKTLMVALDDNHSLDQHLGCFHIYGKKAAGETPDDIIFCNENGVETVSLTDWGDIPEGTTQQKVFHLKNTSTKQGNGLNMQLNQSDFLISTDQVHWSTVIDLVSLGAGQISIPIYVKLALDPPLLTLGPKAARVILTIASWT